MNHFTIYHNPRCSKSREALNLLQTHHITPIIVDYLKTPLNLEQIKKLKTHFDLKDFVRQNESCFKDLKLSLDNEDAILDALVKHPILKKINNSVPSSPLHAETFHYDTYFKVKLIWIC